MNLQPSPSPPPTSYLPRPSPYSSRRGRSWADPYEQFQDDLGEDPWKNFFEDDEVAKVEEPTHEPDKNKTTTSSLSPSQ